MTLLHAFALVALYYAAMYAYSAWGHAVGSAKVIAWGVKFSPHLASMNLTPKQIAMRSAGVVALALVTGIALWMQTWLGIALGLYIGGYQVFLTWTFYRKTGQLGQTDALLRATYNPLMVGALVCEVLDRMGW